MRVSKTFFLTLNLFTMQTHFTIQKQVLLTILYLQYYNTSIKIRYSTTMCETLSHQASPSLSHHLYTNHVCSHNYTE